MTRYAWLALFLQLTLGSLAVGGLLAAQLSLAIKLFLGATFFLVTFLLERNVTAMGVFHEQLLKLIGLLFSALDQGATSGRKGSDLLAGHVKTEQFRFVAGGEGETYFWVQMGQFAVWLVGGWLLATFVLVGRV